MNIDDPKLTAFALDELEEPERSTIARAVAEDPEAQRVVDETREIARALKGEFATEWKQEIKPPLSLSDIRDDPWVWSIGRPLAVAALVAVFALLSALLIGTYSRRESSRPADYVIEAEENSSSQRVELPALQQVSNPVPADVVKTIERVVIGEINAGELHVVETIHDAYRIERLKERLSTPVITKKSGSEPANRGYGLIFIDRDSRIVASALFYHTTDSQFVMQPMRNAYEQNGQYFIGGEAALPGDWRDNVDYDQYVIQFPDWSESIGYAPGA